MTTLRPEGKAGVIPQDDPYRPVATRGEGVARMNLHPSGRRDELTASIDHDHTRGISHHTGRFLGRVGKTRRQSG
jgi:hypothetical protein